MHAVAASGTCEIDLTTEKTPRALGAAEHVPCSTRTPEAEELLISEEYTTSTDAGNERTTVRTEPDERRRWTSGRNLYLNLRTEEVQTLRMTVQAQNRPPSPTPRAATRTRRSRTGSEDVAADGEQTPPRRDLPHGGETVLPFDLTLMTCPRSKSGSRTSSAPLRHRSMIDLAGTTRRRTCHQPPRRLPRSSISRSPLRRRGRPTLPLQIEEAETARRRRARTSRRAFRTSPRGGGGPHQEAMNVPNLTSGAGQMNLKSPCEFQANVHRRDPPRTRPRAPRHHHSHPGTYLSRRPTSRELLRAEGGPYADVLITGEDTLDERQVRSRLPRRAHPGDG